MRAEAPNGLLVLPEVGKLSDQLFTKPQPVLAYKSPVETLELQEMVQGIDSEGFAFCRGPLGDKTNVMALLTGDEQFPTRIPFVLAENQFSLNVPVENTIGFMVNYEAGAHSPGSTRSVIIRAGRIGDPRPSFPLASAQLSDDERLEISYQLFNDPNDQQLAKNRAKENALFRKFDLEERFGFNPKQTRIITQVVQPGVEPFAIPVIPGVSTFEISTYVTRPGTHSDGRLRLPDVISLQSRFNIIINPLQAKKPA
jgi:hypothetical protein